jgi:hypothetical protein
MEKGIIMVLQSFGKPPWRLADDALRYTSVDQSMEEDRAYCYRLLIKITLQTL